MRLVKSRRNPASLRIRPASAAEAYPGSTQNQPDRMHAWIASAPRARLQALFGGHPLLTVSAGSPFLSCLPGSEAGHRQARAPWVRELGRRTQGAICLVTSGGGVLLGPPRRTQPGRPCLPPRVGDCRRRWHHAACCRGGARARQSIPMPSAMPCMQPVDRGQTGPRLPLEMRAAGPIFPAGGGGAPQPHAFQSERRGK